MKHIIITGANGNLGLAVTKKFLDSGYHVTATVRNQAGKAELFNHDNLDVEIVDLTNEEAAGSAVAGCIAKHKKIDAVLMLAGGYAGGDIAHTNGELIKKQLTLNFDTAYFIARPLVQHMLGQKSGRLIFIGSKPALQPAAGKSALAYALSKSMLFKLAEFINEEGKGKNVTASVVAPGTIDTPDNRKAMPDADTSSWVKPEAIADLLECIVSEKGDPLREMVYKVYGDV